MAIFRVWFGVSRVVSNGRLVMGLERFLVLIQLSMACLSYEYPSVGIRPQLTHEWTHMLCHYM